MEGWIKLHRKSLDNFIFKENRPLTRREAWENILLLVNYDKSEILIGNSKYECERGQSIFSLETWSKNFNWDKSKVKRFFDLLQENKMICLENLQKTTRLTVLNYDIYQGDRNANETQTTCKRNANETQTNPIKEEEEVKEEKETKKLKKKEEAIFSPEVENLFLFSKKYFDEKYLTKKVKDTFRLLLENDNFSEHQIENAILNAKGNDFWNDKFLSPVKLRQKNKSDVMYVDVFLNIKSSIKAENNNNPFSKNSFN